MFTFRSRLTLLCYLSFIFFSSCISGESSNTRYDVIIVGAGAAGLAAAAALHKNNVTNFVILEADNRIGGRILTKKFGSYKVDLGPFYVNGHEDDVAYNMSSSYDVFMDDVYQTQVRAPGGIAYPTETYDGLQEMFYRVTESHKLSDFSGPYKDFITRRMGKALKVFYNASDTEIMLDVVMKIEASYFGASLNEIGTRGLSEYGVVDENLKCWKDGYETFLKILMGEYPNGTKPRSFSDKILLNKEVKKIRWDKVTGGGVKISCVDNTEYSGDKVIVTIPLGVMKHDHESIFHPPLPDAKKEAIEVLGYGVMEYVYLLYDNKWWHDLNIHYGMTNDMLKEYKANNNSDWWVGRLTGFNVLPHAPVVLQTWTYGNAAKDMVKASENNVRTAIRDLLQSLFENTTTRVPLASKIVRSSWHNNPYFRGSYSYRTVESDRKNISGEDLAKPLVNSDKLPVVLFAGEATDRYNYGSVVGAVNSGRKVAEQYSSMIRGN